MWQCLHVNDVSSVAPLSLLPSGDQSILMGVLASISIGKVYFKLFFFLGWTEHLRSGNKQQIQSRQTEEIGEEVQDLVDQTKLWTVETWEYLFQMIFFDWLVSNSANWFMVSVQPSSYTRCGRLLSTKDALELHKAIASRLLKSILSENKGKGLPYTFTKTVFVIIEAIFLFLFCKSQVEFWFFKSLVATFKVKVEEPVFLLPLWKHYPCH